MNRKEVSEQIGILNKKLFSSNKELEEMELNLKRKKIEIKKYKNEIAGLKLKLAEIEIEKWKAKKKEGKIPVKKDKKLQEEINSDYYSQEKKFYDIGTAYADYMAKKVAPYND